MTRNTGTSGSLVSRYPVTLPSPSTSTRLEQMQMCPSQWYRSDGQSRCRGAVIFFVNLYFSPTDSVQTGYVQPSDLILGKNLSRPVLRPNVGEVGGSHKDVNLSGHTGPSYCPTVLPTTPTSVFRGVTVYPRTDIRDVLNDLEQRNNSFGSWSSINISSVQFPFLYVMVLRH